MTKGIKYCAKKTNKHNPLANVKVKSFFEQSPRDYGNSGRTLYTAGKYAAYRADKPACL